MQAQDEERMEPQDAGRGKGWFSPEKEYSLATTSILDFWSPEIWQKAFLLF